jgi:F0F1-type ATP synthase assembly protein I
MLYLPHFLTGATILKLAPNPIVGLPLALLSHFILDLTPHNDFDLRPGMKLRDFFHSEPRKRNLIITVLSIDYLFTAVAFLWILTTYKDMMFLAGGIAGVFPDALEQTLMLFGIPLPGWQDKLQWRVSAKYGFISYPIVSAIAIYFLIT